MGSLNDKAADAGCRIEQLNAGPSTCDFECKYCPIYQRYTEEIYLVCKLRSVLAMVSKLIRRFRSKLFSRYLNQ